ARMAALAKPGPISEATSNGDTGRSNCFRLPSGRITVSIGKYHVNLGGEASLNRTSICTLRDATNGVVVRQNVLLSTGIVLRSFRFITCEKVEVSPQWRARFSSSCCAGKSSESI